MENYIKTDFIFEKFRKHENLWRKLSEIKKSEKCSICLRQGCWKIDI